MPLTPSHYLSVLSDAFTPVRDLDGRLLGCIPNIGDTPNDYVLGDGGKMFDLRYSLQPCVCVDLRAQNPHSLLNFVPLDDENADLALPVAGAGEDDDNPGSDPDLARGV